MTRSEAELTTPFARFLSVGLGLLYLGRQDAVEATLEVSCNSCGSPSSLPPAYWDSNSLIYSLNSCPVGDDPAPDLIDEEPLVA